MLYNDKYAVMCIPESTETATLKENWQCKILYKVDRVSLWICHFEGCKHFLFIWVCIVRVCYFFVLSTQLLSCCFRPCSYISILFHVVSPHPAHVVDDIYILHVILNEWVFSGFFFSLVHFHCYIFLSFLIFNNFNRIGKLFLHWGMKAKEL